MAETTPLKRHREEETLTEQETNKKQKPSSSSSSSSYNDQILCLFNDSEELNQPNNDLTSFINTLHQEISSNDQNGVVSRVSNVEDLCVSPKEDDVDEENKEKVMQHLLEASDDELGLPNTEFSEIKYEMIKNDINQDYVYGDGLLDGFGDAFWEFEDEAANYYTLLQSELFL